MSNTIPEVLRAARLLFQPGDVVEVRVPKAGKQKTIAGYFNDFELLAQAIENLEFAKHPGVYWTLNTLDRALLMRGANKLRGFAGREDCTADEDIVRRCWLPIDVDPKRPAGISSTDPQHAASHALALAMRAQLLVEGWPEPIYADSGNGAHLLYRIDLPNDRESRELLSAVLQALAARFNTQEPDAVVQVDQTVFTAARIFKVYGTTARKGDDTSERPHRLSQIIQPPALVQELPVDLLRAMAATLPAKSAPPRSAPYRPNAGRSEFNLEDFLGRFGIRYRARLPYRGGYKYQLEECPFDPSHKAPDACVYRYSDGYAFHCSHNSCAGFDWHVFREHFEGPRPYRSSTHGHTRHAFAPRDEDVPPGAMASGPDITPIEGASPSDAPPVASSVAERPLLLADVEAAADLAIESKSSAEVMRLAPAIAALRPMDQAVVAAKLRDGFKDDWKALEKWFDRALKDAIKELKGEPPEEPASDVTGQNPPAKPPAGGGSGEEPVDLIEFPLTDSGNGQRIAAMFGRDIRFCTEMDSWLIWDGKRWAIDRANVMRHKAMEMARALYCQCLRLPDGSLRTNYNKHARASESSKGITNALLEAERMPGIPVSAQQLDQRQDYLNLRNGTVSLRDGTIKPHDREMLLTKLCEHNYCPDAKCPGFQVFVEWTMGGPIDGNPDAALSEMTVRLVSFLQRVMGYSITGEVSEKAVFVFYGADGDNGKTTLLTLVRELLGRDYASLLLIETIMHARSTDNTAREDMADLRGTRFVQTSEISKEDRLNEQRVKFLTQGMGTIKSRRLHEHLIEFTATHKLLMDCNYRPKVTGQDNAIWRRLVQVPFGYTVPEERKDTGLRDKLHAEAEGILAWMVRGAMLWYKHGLGKPPEVAEAQQDWREHDDPTREFLTDWCNLEEGLFCPVADLMTAYLLWAKEYGEKFPLARRAFNEALGSKGIKQERKHSGRTWTGIEIKTEFVKKLRRDSDEQQYLK